MTDPLITRAKMIGTAWLAGFGFMCDAFDLFVINLVFEVLKLLYHERASVEIPWVATFVMLGAVIGQLAFGVMGDLIGRRFCLIITFILLEFGSVASGALSWPIPNTSISVYQCLMLWRFVLGVGIGGEYPLSATAASEQSSTPSHVASTFSMQGFGNLLAPLTMFILLHATAGYPEELALNIVWRLSLCLAAVYACPALIIRCRMHGEFKPKPRTQWLSTIRKNWKRLIGSAGTWLLFDIVFYGNGLFSSVLLRKLGLDEGATSQAKLISLAKFNIYLSLMALPGYWATMLFVDRIGVKRLQILGFVAMIALYTTIGFAFEHLSLYPGVFMFLYGLTFFFSNFGPNSTTFILPTRIYPPSVRGMSTINRKRGRGLLISAEK
eukprot:TRINITY_DN3307_c0_g1_i2.p1 TRINITY_DN3307_c0_g1~~TRINITY_DN3307_c0_g1_i2.p1  ORF type:complete len:408 (-),score=42.41 TRINITY_DN3307_c0_g1_i2:259-1404(-)